MARKISVAWPELGLTVKATLADELNPALCDEFWDGLPFGIVQSHPVVSGSSVTMWLPYLSTADSPTTESIVDAPLGRIRLSQATGSKLSIQYGHGLEPAKQAVLGLIDQEDQSVLQRVGREAWDNTFWRKQKLTVHFAQLAGDTTAARPRDLRHPLARAMSAAAAEISLDEPRDLAAIRKGEVADAGSFGQYFSVWDAAHGLVRDFVVNTLYPIHQAMNRYDLAQVRIIYATVAAKYHFTLRYHGWSQLADFAEQFKAVLDESDDLDVVREVSAELLRYGNMTYGWSHQAFPWYVGMNFATPGTGNVGGVWTPT